MHWETLELKEKVLGRENPSTLSSMNNLALVLNSQGKYKEAEQIRRALIKMGNVTVPLGPYRKEERKSLVSKAKTQPSNVKGGFWSRLKCW